MTGSGCGSLSRVRANERRAESLYVGGETLMYHGANRREIEDRRKGERREFDPVVAQAYEERVGRGEFVERRKLKDRRQQARRESDRGSCQG